MSSRIKTGFMPEEPMPANMPADFDWLKANRDSLVDKYGKCMVVIYEKQVLGIGESYSEALTNAEANLPESPEIITPIVEPIGYPSFRLRRVRHAEG